MQLIEPCCAPKHLLTLRESLGECGTALWHGYGDLSLAELLPSLLLRYCETDLIIVSPSLPDDSAGVMLDALRSTRARMDGKGNLLVIRHMTLITDISNKRSPLASTWLKDNPFGDRLILRPVCQNDTAILLPDIALWGPLNLVYGGHFTAMATTSARTISALRKGYLELR